MAGDGTTSVTVICGALLKKCLDLLERGVHPTVISDAFNKAADRAVEVGTIAAESLHGIPMVNSISQQICTGRYLRT